MASFPQNFSLSIRQVSSPVKTICEQKKTSASFDKCFLKSSAEICLQTDAYPRQFIQAFVQELELKFQVLPTDSLNFVIKTAP